MRSLVVTDPVVAVPVVYLWPHSKCNCRCVMCDIWRLHSRQEISADDVERWLEDWKALAVQQVVLTGGEALMHSDLWSLCDVLKAAGISIVLLSTGVTLERWAHQVVDHVDRLNVSLDGPPAVHDEIRRIPRAFHRLAAGVRRVRSLRPSLSIVARSAIHRRNCAHLSALVDVAHDLSLDGISFLATDMTSEAFNRPQGWTPDRASDVALSAVDLQVLERQVERLTSDYSADFASGFIREQPEWLRRHLVEYYRAHLGKGPLPEVVCNAPWVSAVIEYDGAVKPCFFQPAYGSLADGRSLSEILHSPRAVSFRANLDMRTDPICQRCVCPLAVHQCDCGLSRSAPYCDRACRREPAS